MQYVHTDVQNYLTEQQSGKGVAVNTNSSENEKYRVLPHKTDSHEKKYTCFAVYKLHTNVIRGL